MIIFSWKQRKKDCYWNNNLFSYKTDKVCINTNHKDKYSLSLKSHIQASIYQTYFYKRLLLCDLETEEWFGFVDDLKHK